jgi:hypothetical protein
MTPPPLSLAQLDTCLAQQLRLLPLRVVVNGGRRSGGVGGWGVGGAVRFFRGRGRGGGRGGANRSQRYKLGASAHVPAIISPHVGSGTHKSALWCVHGVQGAAEGARASRCGFCVQTRASSSSS